MLALVVSGCWTVKPVAVQARRASLDGTVANSGLLGTNSLGEWVLTAGGYARYEALRVRYSTRFSPPLLQRDGVAANIETVNTWTVKYKGQPVEYQPNTMVMDDERMVDFGQMSYFARNPK